MSIKEKLEKHAGKIFVGGVALVAFSGGITVDRAIKGAKEPVETFIADDGKKGIKMPSDLETPVAGVLTGTAFVAAGLFGAMLRKENEDKQQTAAKMRDMASRNR